MTQHDFSQIRRRLEADRADLQQQIEAFSVANEDQGDDYGAKNHSADDGQDVFLRERNLALRASSEERIDEIDDALSRMDAGAYGICENCGKPIPPERLEALPFATRDVACAALLEQ
ncbi:MAG: TraR/DksA C4-type zinc finger protein, partial [Chloroflexales bacterium]|nr:TraR/DksA C4-type zinc finger protein [Chloroflexales bacterium]